MPHVSTYWLVCRMCLMHLRMVCCRMHLRMVCRIYVRLVCCRMHLRSHGLMLNFHTLNAIASNAIMAKTKIGTARGSSAKDQRILSLPAGLPKTLGSSIQKHSAELACVLTNHLHPKVDAHVACSQKVSGCEHVGKHM